MWKHNDSYKERLQTMLRGMTSQGLGHASGPHSSFIPYHVDAITLQAVGLGWHDEMAMGRVVESLFRSLNNLLEHFHQSFFFYLLMQANRFVSIGTYLPSAMLVAVNFTIMAISLWVQSGRPPKTNIAASIASGQAEKPEFVVVKKDGMTAMIPKQELTIVERELFFPAVFVLSLHLLGVIPLYLFNNTSQVVRLHFQSFSLFLPGLTNLLTFYLPQNLPPTVVVFTVFNLLFPHLLSFLLTTYSPPNAQQLLLTKCFSLLLLGMFLATLSTLNFSLAFLIGLLAAPLSFLGMPSASNPSSRRRLWRVVIESLVLHALSPPVVFGAVCYLAGVSVDEVLAQAAFGWWVSGLWTQVVVWCVWWPAWVVAAVGVGLGIVGR